MKVSIHMMNTSQAIEHEYKNCYQKGDLYCVLSIDGMVYKYPIVNIFRIVEDYSSKDIVKKDK